jgi:hypothetical protein
MDIGDIGKVHQPHGCQNNQKYDKAVNAGIIPRSRFGLGFSVDPDMFRITSNMSSVMTVDLFDWSYSCWPPNRAPHDVVIHGANEFDWDLVDWLASGQVLKWVLRDLRFIVEPCSGSLRP